MENACVSPIYRHSLSESQSVAYKGKNAPGAPRTQPGELCWDFPAPEAVNRGPAERDTPGFPPPSCAAARPRVDVSALACVCEMMLMGAKSPKI